MDMVDQGWALADKCARLANQGADVASLLVAIFDVIDTPLAVYDSYQSVIAQYPPTTDWDSTDGSRGNKGTLNIPLPMGLQNTCSLVITAADAENKLDALLGPVSSILALQLNRSVVVDPSSHQEIKKLVEACEMWDEYSHGDVRRAVQDVGLDPRKEIGLVVADVSGEFHATSWRLRVALHEAFNVVRVTDIDDRLIAFTQSPRDDLDTISHTLLSIQSKQPVVVKLPTASLYQLRMSLVHSLQLVEHIERPQIAPSLGLGAVVAATAGRGARESAQNFLRPLVEHDEMRAGQLVETLNAFLRHDARPTPTCAELFIHRNSLNYRIRKISDLLMVDLNSVEGQATCLIALKLDELAEK
jgi:hypothetical protein